ncbi:MAG: universal stress protein [Desulfobacterales bacterium]|nr:universal stress protein [Desulfobacterales bacterium]
MSGRLQNNMVVMCRRGKTGDFDMGSVALKVVASAPVPVVIAPGFE